MRKRWRWSSTFPITTIVELIKSHNLASYNINILPPRNGDAGYTREALRTQFPLIMIPVRLGSVFFSMPFLHVCYLSAIYTTGVQLRACFGAWCILQPEYFRK